MSEPVGLDGEARNTVSDASASAVYAGQLLRQAREATGLHVAALAVSLKVPVATLDALEAGRIDLLLDLTFARALAASVCRNLKIDPAPVLEHLPPTGASRLGAEAPAINTPFRPPGSGPRLSFRSQMSSPVVLAVAALLIAALAVVFWPKAPEEAVVLATGTEASDTPTAATPAPNASMPTAETPAPAPAPAVVASAPQVQVPLPASSAPVATSVAPLVLTATAESWVKVTDAKGVVALGRTLNPGEVVEVAGVLPMAVVVGRTDAVQLQVRGQPFDMAPFAKDRVARFQVK